MAGDEMKGGGVHEYGTQVTPEFRQRNRGR